MAPKCSVHLPQGIGIKLQKSFHTPKKGKICFFMAFLLHLVVHLAKWEKWSLGLERNSPSTDDLSESEPFTT